MLVMAGDYAHSIQKHIQPASSKDGENPWTQALTDADLMVQHMLEVATLAGWSDIGFFGEESEQSANTKYFPTDAETIIQLDPINGTFLYQHQRAGWDIVMSICHQNQLEAALSYMPVQGLFYLATRETGALKGNRSSLSLQEMQPLKTRADSRRCLTYRADDIKKKLGESFDCFDIVKDDDPKRDFQNLNDLFTGKLAAFASRTDDLLDWGATAFIVKRAGGCVSYLDGTAFDLFDDFDPRAAADILVSATPEIHAEILTLLKHSS